MAIDASRLRRMNPRDQRAELAAHAPPSQAGAITALSDANTAKLTNAVANVAEAASNPGDADSAQAVSEATVQNPLVAAIAHHMLATAGWALWEARDDAMNPVSGIKRRKPFPVKLLPANATLTNGAGVIEWEPQEEFQGFRVCFPSSNFNVEEDLAQDASPTSGYMNQFMVGDRLMQAQSGRLPLACLSEFSDMGRIDLPICRLGELITASISGVTLGNDSTELEGVIFGYARGKNRILPEGAEILGDRWEPFDVTEIAPGEQVSILLNPQRHIILRRIAVDMSQPGMGNVQVNAINVQDDPQFVVGFNIPVSLFNAMGQDEWLDFDLCQLGGEIAIVVTNTDTSITAVFQGFAICDLVRLKSDPR